MNPGKNALISRSAKRYGLTLIYSVIALVLTGAALPLSHTIGFQFLLAAVVLIAIRMGGAPAVFSLIVCAIASNLLFLEPLGRFTTPGHEEFSRWLMFISLGGLLVWVGSRLHTSLEKEVELVRIHREREARLQALFEQTAVGIAEVGLDGRFLRVNPRFCALLGYSSEELRSRHFSDLTYPDDMERDREAFQRSLEGNEAHWSLEKRYLRKDGSSFWAMIHRTMIRDSRGKPLHTLTVVEDITERKRAEEELERREATFRSVFDSNIVGFVFGRPDGRLEQVNDYYLNLIGYTREEFESGAIRWDRITPPEYLHRDVQALEEVRTHRITPPYEKPYIRKDGTWVWVRISIGLIEPSSERLVAVVNDITDRKQKELALRESEGRLALALEAGTAGIFDWDTKNNVNHWSNEMLALYGLAGKRFGGRYEDWLECIVPEDREKITAVTRSLMEKKSMQTVEFNTEFRIRRQDTGAIRWMVTKGRTYYDPGGEPVRVIGINVDITQEKLAEQARAESESRLKAVLESLPIGVFVADSKGQLIHANPMARKIWGQSPLVPISEYKEYRGWWPDTGKRLESRDWALSKAIVNGETIRDEILNIETFDGTRKVIWNNAIPVIGPNGERYGGISVLNDITEQRRLQEELERSEERLALALETAGMGTWDWDLKGNSFFCGERMRYLLGYDSGRVLKSINDCLEHVHPDDRGYVVRDIQAAIDKGAGFSTEFRLAPWAGKANWLFLQGRVFRNPDGKPVRIIGTVLDMSERKKLELSLQAALKIRDEMLGIVSHDLKNPLGAIDLNAAMLIRAEGKSLSADFVRRRVETIRQSSSRMLRLISDLLDVTRIEAGRLEVQARECTTKTVVRAALQEVRSLAEAKGIRLEEFLDCSEERLVCDPDRMSQVFGNILGNAIKFVPEQGGQIDIRTECSGDEIRFAIRDNGPGIPAEDLPHIFDRFWHTRHSKKAGTGLGLAIANGIVKAHGGRIWAESAGKGGATFWIAIPKAKSHKGRQILAHARRASDDSQANAR